MPPPAKSVEVQATAEEKTPAPAFNLISLDGKKFELASLRGKIVVLNLWFTGCPPCLTEIPKLNELVEEFSNGDVVFIAPTLDAKAVLPNFLKTYPFKYNIVADAGDMIINTYGDGSGNLAMPTHIVIDQDGNIDIKIVGGLFKADGSTPGLDDLRNAITRLNKRLKVKMTLPNKDNLNRGK